MTDYLELLLAALEAQGEQETTLRLPRRRRAAGRSGESEPPEERTAPETGRAGETPELPPEERSDAPSRERQTARDALPRETAGVRDALYREMDRARETLRRRGQAGQYVQGGTARRAGVTAAEHAPEWDAWETLSGAPGQTRYAALVDAEFQRDARRYDGALGLL